LQPIPTDFEHLEDGGIRFLVRILRHLARKPRAEAPAPSPAAARPNPFLPYDPAMYVADASPTHVCLLNKFNVVERHLLIVTRAFEDQETPLTPQDFEALGTCLTEGEGLGFYNSGAVAGASQPHKHLQLVPLPLDPDGASLPIAPLVDATRIAGDVVRLDALPFAHAIAALDADMAASPQRAAALTVDVYRRLLQAIGVSWPVAGERFSKPYNLLITRRWMLAVPRTRECFESISCNSLAFAGAWLVRDREQLELLKRFGPRAALRRVTEP
jgi:ATP adenylyltransferase